MIKVNLLTGAKREAVRRTPTVRTESSGGSQNILLIVVLALSVAFVGWRYYSLSAEGTRLDSDLETAHVQLKKVEDDRKAIATWKLQAAQGVGDQDAFAAAIESFLAGGFADPENVAAMHRQLAAIYSGKKDNAKTLEHFKAFVDATPDVAPDEYETLGRLQLQASQYAEACQTLGKAIDLSKSKGAKPKEMWFQLRDRCFIELKDDASRLANLEALVGEYPDKEYYGRIVALYQAQTKDDRVVMLNAYRVAVSDPEGGLATVGAYLNYADTAMNAGSPGEAQRGLERRPAARFGP